MRTIYLAAGMIFLAGQLCSGATNDAAGTLQRGLFEEEANQNLSAAIQAYKEVANQFEKDRKLAATAVFRIAECYRKQGATSEAVAQYEKVLRDFPDQSQLVNLSRQQLKTLGGKTEVAVTDASVGTSLEPRGEWLTLESQLAEMKKLPREQLRIAVQQNFPNPVLTSLMQKLAESEQNLAAAKRQYGPQHAEVLKAADMIDVISKQIDAQIEAAWRGLEIKRDAMKKAAENLQDAASRQATAGQATDTLTSSEADEVKHIQAMIKDSPDLINAKDGSGTTPLHRAAIEDHLLVAKFLLANGATVDAKDARGLTPLHMAARAGHKAMAELLLDNKANVQAATYTRMTPLHFAAENGFRSVADLLLSRGADVNAKTRDGATPLLLATANGFKSVAELLIVRGADVNAATSPVQVGGKSLSGPPLAMAVAIGDTALLELLLTNRADTTVPDQSGRLPLHLAADAGNIPAAEALLAHGADVNAQASGKDWQGWTPLHSAVNAHQNEMVEFLLKNKADPNARIGTRYGEGGDGYTPLLIATARVFPEIVDALLAGGADPKLGNGSRYPILNALNNEDPKARAQMVKTLVARGARLDVRDGNNNTPLLLATVRVDPESLSALLPAKPDLNAQDKIGRSALHLLAMTGEGPRQLEVAKILLNAGINPNLRDKDGNTPLLQAASYNQPLLVDLLLKNNADPNIQNNFGSTPLDFGKRLSSPNYSGGIPINPASGLPGGAVTLTVANSSATEPSPAPGVAELLQQHGALANLPRTNQIQVSRTASHYSRVVFTRVNGDGSRFTLFDLLATQYGMSKQLLRDARIIAPDRLEKQEASQNPLAFPDFTNVRIRRLAPDRKTWQDQPIDVAAAFKSGDCSANVPLQWGDIVEIPEQDHVLNDSWSGLSNDAHSTLVKCLARQVEVTVKGQTTNLDLTARWSSNTNMPLKVAPPEFELEPVLQKSKLLLASSELSRIRVSRRDPATGQERVWIVNCSRENESRSPDLFWLQDGDKIEVPDKGPDVAPSYYPKPMPIPGSGLPPSRRAGTIPPRPNQRTFGQTLYPVPNENQQPVEEPEPASKQRVSPAPAIVPEPNYLNVDGVLYSPSAEDSKLLEAGYQRDTSIQTRTGQAWEQKPTAVIEGRGGNTIVWTGKEMIVFGGEGMGTSYDNGARFDLSKNSWDLLPHKNGPSSRTGATAVWTGKEMIVWGGFGGRLGKDTNRNDGARYYPNANSWKPVSTENVPEARFDHSAVWTGKEMLIWGGYTDSHSRYQGAYTPAFLDTGGRYNPGKDSWQSMTTKGAPSKRFANAAVWSGKEMLIWGGADEKKALSDGARYNPARDSWKPISSQGAPGPRSGAAAVWTGKEMIVWGGSTRDGGPQAICFRDGARYNPDTDKWKAMSTEGAPKGRVQTTAIWTGKVLVIWGGVNDAEAKGVSDSNRYVGTGALYNPETDSWTPITDTGAPAPRLTSGVWTGDGLLLFGGYDGMHLNDAWYFSPKETLYPYTKK